MSFFGALFAGVVLLSKGMITGQNIAEDNRLKKRADQLGQNTYYDHKGIMHDRTTGRAITYHTDPFTGHQLICDEYTLNALRDLTAEKRVVEIRKEMEKAEKNSESYYKWGNLSRDAKGYIKTYNNKYEWNKAGSMKKFGKDYGNKTGKALSGGLLKIHYELGFGNIYKVDLFYSLQSNNALECIQEKYDDYIVYTDLKTGKVVDITNNSKVLLKEKGIEWKDYIRCINEAKDKYVAEDKSHKIPISLYC